MSKPAPQPPLERRAEEEGLAGETAAVRALPGGQEAAEPGAEPGMAP